MYEDHFGLAGRPFQLTPDPRFWFETATHRKAMAYLGYGLAQGEGFIVITGDIGAGKTTLVGHLMERIDATRLNPIRIVSTQVEADDLLRIVAAGLGVEAAGRSKAELLALVERALHGVARTGRRTLLIVDEAQALPVSALEELRMLSNFQAGGHALLQIFLLGQPEFRDRLHGSDRLEQLRQRVIATHHLDPMEPAEVEAYVAHRLSLVGWRGRPDFADDSFPALYRATGGVPRRLNQLAGRVLLHCAVEGVELIDAALVKAVADDGMSEMRVAEPVPEPVEAAAVVRDESVAAEPEAEPEPVAPAPRAYLVPPAPPPEPAVEDELPAPRPMTPQPPAAAPRPIRLAAETSHPHPSAPDGAPSLSHWERGSGPTLPPAGSEQRGALFTPDRARSPEASGKSEGENDPATIAPQAAPADDRLAALEARLEAQDAALRRVLTLLVDWVEGDGDREGRAGVADLRDAAA